MAEFINRNLQETETLKQYKTQAKKTLRSILNLLNTQPAQITKSFKEDFEEYYGTMLVNLQEQLAKYMIEVMGAENPGNLEAWKEKHVNTLKDGIGKYLDEESETEAIKSLGEKLPETIKDYPSVSSLLAEGAKKLSDLLSSDKNEEEDFKYVAVYAPILPSDNEQGQNDTKRQKIRHQRNTKDDSEELEIGFRSDKFKILKKIIKDNGASKGVTVYYYRGDSTRKNTYKAIYIPQINKTVFLNTGYGEATFICEGEVSIDYFTMFGKEGLKKEKQAIKINFRNDNTGNREKTIKELLFGSETNSETIEIATYDEIKDFYTKNKNETFKGKDGNEHTIEELFLTSGAFYRKNYVFVNDNPNFDIRLPSLEKIYKDRKTWSTFIEFIIQ